MMGRLMIKVKFNFSELLRTLQKKGWQVIDSLVFRSVEQIEALKGRDVSFLKVGKGHLTYEVPPAYLGRMQYSYYPLQYCCRNLRRFTRKGWK